MAIARLDADLMRDALTELGQASYNHDQWAERFHGTMISRRAPETADISDEPHRKCRFGQWYYSAPNEALHCHPGFAGIGIEHERMHCIAASLLRSSAAGKPITSKEYEDFVAARKRLGLEIATVRREFEEELNGLDPLTGMPGRMGMLTKLREQHEMAARRLQSCVIAMLDLDHFKLVNDNYGHPVGDQVLIRISRQIAANLRPYDKVYRYGGEEFLICLPGVDEALGFTILDRLRRELADLRHEATARDPFTVTVSIGLCLLDPSAPVELSVNRADMALYAAKEAGRNCVMAWRSSSNSAASQAA
jgi:diguanylate cyclase (GGDEF)-like protein